MIKDRLKSELVSAMKENNTVRKNTLRSVITAVSVEEKQKPDTELNDGQIIDVINKLRKQRVQAMDMYVPDSELYLNEKAEMDILLEYLPVPLTENEIENIILDLAKDNSYTKKDMGLIIKHFNVNYQGRSDGKTVSMLVGKLIN